MSAARARPMLSSNSERQIIIRPPSFQGPCEAQSGGDGCVDLSALGLRSRGGWRSAKNRSGDLGAFAGRRPAAGQEPSLEVGFENSAAPRAQYERSRSATEREFTLQRSQGDRRAVRRFLESDNSHLLASCISCRDWRDKA